MNIDTKHQSALFLGGMIVGAVVTTVFFKKKKTATDDSCNSLFYSMKTGPHGSGHPNPNEDVTLEEIQALKVVQKEYIKLPFDQYKFAVENLPICCVDIVCQRKFDKKILLFFRRDKPANDLWWWPGGRMFRGETFFETAVRKVRDETGYKSAAVKTVGVIDVWNTFFPTSNWDNDRRPGFEGTQTVNISVMCTIENGADLTISMEAQKDWAVEDSKWVSVEEALQPGKFDKYISLNVQKAVELGYL